MAEENNKNPFKFGDFVNVFCVTNIPGASLVLKGRVIDVKNDGVQVKTEDEIIWAHYKQCEKIENARS